MTKTLNQFLEGYLKVKSSDEQKFVDKHVAVANPDRNGNGDDVFKGAKVKTINRRKERKGYDAGDDAKVYEETELTEQLDSRGAYTPGTKVTVDGKKGEISHVHHSSDHPKYPHDYRVTSNGKHLESGNYISHNRIKLDKTNEEAELEEKAPPGAKYERMVKHIKKGYAKGGLTAKEKAIAYATAWKAKKANEEVEQISESLFGTTTHGDQDSAKSKVKDMHTKLMKSGYRPKYGAVDHSKLRLDGYGTKYSKPGSGHEIHVSAHRDRAGEQIRVSVDKKKVNEETEQIDELSKKTLGSYQTKAIAGPMDDTVDTKRVSRSKRAAGIRLAGKKMYPEIAKHNGGKAKVAATEETLVDILSGLKESHIRTMVEVYESLNEENQAKFVATCKKEGGIDAMLNFAIKNRGE